MNDPSQNENPQGQQSPSNENVPQAEEKVPSAPLNEGVPSESQTPEAGSAPEQQDDSGSEVVRQDDGADAGIDAGTVRQQPREVVVPGPEFDDELEKEVENALGDVSLLSVYGMEESHEEPQTPAEEESVSSESEHKPPNILHGKVTSIGKDGLFIGGLGGRSQGFLPAEELEEDEKIEVGDSVDVVIVRYDARDGILMLSKKAAAQQILRSNLKEGVHVEVRVTGTNKGGLEVYIKGGLKAFMPASQVDIGRVEDFETLVGQRFVCEVIQVDRGDRNIVVSRRNVLEKEQAQLSEKLWAELEKGQTHQGRVRSIADYGAFVDIGGADGLLHVSEMSWARVNNPRDILEVGQTIDVVIKDVDKEAQRISLSMKLAGGDPWDTVDQKYYAGAKTEAKIVKLMNFGAFAELAPGIDGLIPISEMTWLGRVRHPSDVVKPGDMVEVEILSVDTVKRRISMSIKQVQDNPWEDVQGKYLNEHTYTGTVARLTDFGAFVTLEPGIDGLVHISELSDRRVIRAGEVVKEGQEVQVKVVGVDVDNQRISLSMKGLSGEISKEEIADSTESASDKQKKERPRRGGLS